MKKESFNKKITLNKETIAHLELKQIGNVKGGIIPTLALTQCKACTLTVLYTDCPEC